MLCLTFCETPLSFSVRAISSWVQQIAKPHIPKKFNAHPVCNTVYHFRYLYKSRGPGVIVVCPTSMR